MPDDEICCQSECPVCVWDIYYEELAKWRAQEAKAGKGDSESNQQQAQISEWNKL